MINWKLRLQNKTTLVTLIILAVGFVYQVISLFGIVPTVSEEQITNALVLLVNILVTVGVVVDPTTAGITDSKQALTYNEPKTKENI